MKSQIRISTSAKYQQTNYVTILGEQIQYGYDISTKTDKHNWDMMIWGVLWIWMCMCVCVCEREREREAN